MVRLIQKTAKAARWKQFILDPASKRVRVSLVDAEGDEAKPRYAFAEPPKSMLARLVDKSREVLKRTVLPEGYPHSVHENFVAFNVWNFLQSVAGSANGVLATQCLLVGLGMSGGGGHGTIALAATVNWILKDGLGQLGGILFVARYGGNVDREAKRYRFLASALMSVASACEILIPVVPALFLPIASLANVCKNIAWMALSATRAQIHRNFTRLDNLGDLTAKAASLNTAASLAGTGLGVLLSSAFLISAAGGAALAASDLVTRCLFLSLPLTLFYLYASYRCSGTAISPRLTLQRIELLMRGFTPAVKEHGQLHRYILDPTQTCKKERFLYWPWEKDRLSSIAFEPDARALVEFPHFPKLLSFFQENGYVVLPSGPNKVAIWFAQDQSEKAILLGLLTAYICRSETSNDTYWIKTLEKAHAQQTAIQEEFIAAVLLRGWSLTDPLDVARSPLSYQDDKTD
jgi:hypothetical protein